MKRKNKYDLCVSINQITTEKGKSAYKSILKGKHKERVKVRENESE